MDNQRVLYNTRVHWKDSQFVEYAKESGLVDSEGEDEDNLLYLINKENPDKKEDKPETLISRLLGFNFKEYIDNLIEEYQQEVSQRIRVNYWIPAKSYISEWELLSHCAESTPQKALQARIEILYSQINNYIDQRGKNIADRALIGLLCFITSLLLLWMLKFPYINSLFYIIWGSACTIEACIALMVGWTKFFGNGYKAIDLVNFLHSDLGASNTLEGLIIKALKFLREFEIVHRGQRIGMARNILLQQATEKSIADCLAFSNSYFLDLRTTIKESNEKCKDILKSVLERVNEGKYRLIQMSNNKGSEDELLSKELQNGLEDLVVLKEEVQGELKVLLDKFKAKLVTKQDMMKIMMKYMREESQEYNMLETVLKHAKLSYQEVDEDKPDTDKKESTVRATFEVKHLQSLIAIQNNYKTLKRHIQSDILALKAVNTANSNEAYNLRAELIEKFEDLARLESELTRWHSSIYENIITDLKQKNSGGLKPKKREEDDNENSKAEPDEFEGKEVVRHDEEGHNADNKDKEDDFAVYEVEANLDLINENDRRANFLSKEDKAYTANMNTVIDELRDLLPSKKKTYKMRLFRQDRHGEFKEEDNLEEVLRREEEKEREMEMMKEKEEEDAKKKIEDYKIEQFGFISDFRMDLASELRNRKVNRRDSEDEVKVSDHSSTE